MKRSKKLSPIIDITVKSTEKALMNVGQANAVLAKDKQQLEELRRYKEGYLDKLRQEDNLSTKAQKVLELRGFLIQLDQAIEAQQQQVNISFKALQYQQQLWQQKRTKEQVMQSLVNRYQQEEAQLELKQEQQINDEMNTIKWSRKVN